MKVNIAGVTLDNPVIAASGTFGLMALGWMLLQKNCMVNFMALMLVNGSWKFFLHPLMRLLLSPG